MQGPTPNRLERETSPYLRQHADNPVDWYPWGPEALGRARQEDRLVLLSIGYSACHWCHVMERESFEDPATAALMNEHFVNVKVDREERPDLDEIYMAATLALNRGQGGWPMTVFLTPELEPVFAGTYFPPADRYGRPGFRTVLRAVADAWTERRDEVRLAGREIVELVRRQTEPLPGTELGPELLERALEQLAVAFDDRWGGFGAAPKFPPTATLSLLLRVGHRTGDPRAHLMVERTLEMMARGGIRDHLGGGFARYSTDDRWLVPHFEKMLYDNALLAVAFLDGAVATGSARFAEVGRETLEYLEREMVAPEGGFYSSTDADSEGEEGRFFVWSEREVRALLGVERARTFGAHYDLTPKGNWEGRTILNTPRSLEETAASIGREPRELARELAECRLVLADRRAQRIPPDLDDKVVTAWNGMAIRAFARGAEILDEPRFAEVATRAAEFVLGSIRRDDGSLARTWREGAVRGSGVLEDYAWLADALISLYESTGVWRHLEAAVAVAEAMRERFRGDDGGFFHTAADADGLVVRYREGHDGATPAANAVAARALVRLGHHLDRSRLVDEGRAAIEVWSRLVAGAPRAFCASLSVVDRLLGGPVQLAFVGTGSDPRHRALRRAAAQLFLPNRIVAQGEPGTEDHPLLVGRPLVGGRPALYVCREFVCHAPVTEPGEVAPAVDASPGR